jgi:hypothetical protein
MRNKPIYILLLSCITSLLVYAQTPSEQIELLSPKNSKSISVDKLGDIYILNENQEVRKYLKQQKIQFTYTNKLAGEIGSIDVTIPQKTLIFYPDIQQLTILNRQFEVLNEFKLKGYVLNQITLAAISENNSYWLFDNLNYKVIRIGQNTEPLVEGIDLSRVLRKAVRPTKMLEQMGQVYLLEPSIGILVIDNFGAYVKTIPIKNISNFSIAGNIIYFQKEGTWFAYNSKSLETTLLLDGFNAETCKKTTVQLEFLYCLREKQVVLYTIKKQ